MQVQLMEMMEKADGFCLASDTLLDSETADIHSNSLQGIYAKQTTTEECLQSNDSNQRVMIISTE